jgi:hypothetical protein
VDDKPPTPSRRGLFPEDGEILDTIGKLRGLYTDTQPSGSERAAPGKDVNARIALSLAASLFKDLAGWAVDHHVGLALAGVASAPKPINEEQPDEWHQQRTAAADSHEHEAAAAQYEFADPILNRQIAAQLLAVDAPLPSRLAYELVRALQALEVGERLAILDRAGRGDGVRYRQDELRRRAMLHLEYRAGLRIRADERIEQISSVYKISKSTVEQWRKEFKDELHDAKQRARNLGAHVYNAKMNPQPGGQHIIELGENIYGNSALKFDGAAYYELRRQEEVAGPKVVSMRRTRGGRRRTPRS